MYCLVFVLASSKRTQLSSFFFFSDPPEDVSSRFSVGNVVVSGLG